MNKSKGPIIRINPGPNLNISIDLLLILLILLVLLILLRWSFRVFQGGKDNYF